LRVANYQQQNVLLFFKTLR